MAKMQFIFIGTLMVLISACQVSIPNQFTLTGGGGSGTTLTGGNNSGGGGGNTNNPTPTPTPPGPRLPQTIEFVIQPNTGTGPWNSVNAFVEVKVGDTIRIRNMDSVLHELHMPGNSTCPHGSAGIPTGGFYDCVTTKVFETSKTSPQSYDHLGSPSLAPFYFKVTQ